MKSFTSKKIQFLWIINIIKLTILNIYSKICSKLISPPVKVQTSNASNSHSVVNTNTSPVQQNLKPQSTNQKSKENSADLLVQSEKTVKVKFYFWFLSNNVNKCFKSLIYI